jgi:hypothetical protein
MPSWPGILPPGGYGIQLAYRTGAVMTYHPFTQIPRIQWTPPLGPLLLASPSVTHLLGKIIRFILFHSSACPKTRETSCFLSGQETTPESRECFMALTVLPCPRKQSQLIYLRSPGPTTASGPRQDWETTCTPHGGDKIGFKRDDAVDAINRGCSLHAAPFTLKAPGQIDSFSIFEVNTNSTGQYAWSASQDGCNTLKTDDTYTFNDCKTAFLSAMDNCESGLTFLDNNFH